ncbi:GntR family transcriptional regulator [Nocardioides marmorisolisilvae]|uniref:GntR family transcriptional regulator n=1 Tax=Nocardioides marmorisolisilvae TaxID=1542737 RepID=UPI001617F2F0|nr:GntR family transcriptional regulator [Nocardioides marmorisolisilvae]
MALEIEHWTLDDADPRPPYEQIRARIAAGVAADELEPGLRLPTVRALAEDLGVATNTVARAYRELEASGVIETRGRGGSFVTGDQVERRAREAAAAYLAQAKALGLTAAEAVALVRHLEEHPIRSS